MAQSAWVVLRGSGLPRGCGPGCVVVAVAVTWTGFGVSQLVCVYLNMSWLHVAACGWLHVAVTVLRALETKNASRS